MKEDLYCRKRWCTVQFLADQFWVRWRKEYMLALQQRSKWNKQPPNLKPGDIVLVKDECKERNQWPLGLVDHVHPSGDGLVRKVTVTIGQSLYDRPVHKLVFIHAPGNPVKEPSAT